VSPEILGHKPRPEIEKIARLPAADDANRFALVEIRLGE